MIIEVNKVILDQKDNKISVEKDYFPVSDIKNFRPWKKTALETSFTDKEMTQVSIKSTSAAGGFYNIRILESSKEFANRVGFIPLNESNK